MDRDRDPFVVKPLGYGELTRLRLVQQQFDELRRLLHCEPDEVVERVEELMSNH